MITKIVYRLNADDPNWAKQIEEAFNLCYEFCRELYMTLPTGKPGPELRSLNRVTNGEFDDGDIECLVEYSLTVYTRIMIKYGAEPLKSADWADTCRANASHLRTIVRIFKLWVEQHRDLEQFKYEPGTFKKA